MKRKDRVAIYGAEGQGINWLAANDVVAFWQNIEAHFEVPGHTAAGPNADGEAFGAHLWRSGGDRLLGFQRFC